MSINKVLYKAQKNARKRLKAIKINGIKRN